MKNEVTTTRQVKSIYQHHSNQLWLLNDTVFVLRRFLNWRSPSLKIHEKRSYNNKTSQVNIITIQIKLWLLNNQTILYCFKDRFLSQHLSHWLQSTNHRTVGIGGIDGVPEAFSVTNSQAGIGYPMSPVPDPNLLIESESGSISHRMSQA